MLNIKLFSKVKQFIKFGIVGLGNNLIFLLVYYILLYFNVNYQISNICAYIISSLVGYTISKIWVFEAINNKDKKSLLRYYIVYGSSFLISISFMYILVDRIEMSKTTAPYLLLCITIPYNFLLCKFWVYKNQYIKGGKNLYEIYKDIRKV